MTARARLEIRNVSKSFAGLRAVGDISLEAEPGRITAVIGPNGAGKTTLFNCVTGITAADRNESRLVHDDGTNVALAGLPPEEICRAGIARTFQHVRLFDSLSAVDNVALARLVRREMGMAAAIADRLVFSARRHKALRREALELLAEIGLAPVAEQLAANLDHGSRRRLEIARALASEPALILLDEPAAGMNHTETAELMRYLQQLAGRGLAVLLIEHDMRLVMTASHQIYVMDHGEMLASGTPREVVANPKVIEAYLGTGGLAHAAA